MTSELSAAVALVLSGVCLGSLVTLWAWARWIEKWNRILGPSAEELRERGAL